MEQILNFESLLVRVGNDIELVNEILHLFIDTTPEQIDTLQLALKENDIELIKYYAHILKGSAGNISAEKLANTASLLETVGKEGNFKGAESLFPSLLEEYEALETLIRERIADERK